MRVFRSSQQNLRKVHLVLSVWEKTSKFTEAVGKNSVRKALSLFINLGTETCY